MEKEQYIMQLYLFFFPPTHKPSDYELTQNSHFLLYIQIFSHLYWDERIHLSPDLQQIVKFTIYNQTDKTDTINVNQNFGFQVTQWYINYNSRLTHHGANGDIGGDDE